MTTFKAAVVTGTARPLGIGRAIARSLINSGFKVLGVDNQPAAEGSRADEGPSYVHHICDISNPKDVSQVWPTVVSALGHGNEAAVELTVLVNNAAVVDPSMPPLSDPAARLARWRQVIDANLTGTFLMCEALAPHMANSLSSTKNSASPSPGGSEVQSCIINISSTRARMSEPNSEAYAASKAGLVGLTHALASSLAGKARVNAVLPGWIDTSGGADLRQDDHEWHFAGRVGVPDDVAGMCLFLVSPGAAFITGQEFVVDGGVTKKMVYPE